MRPSGASAPAVWASHSQRAAAGAGSTKPQIGIHIRPNRQTPPSLACHVEPYTPIIPNGNLPHERKELKQALLVNPSSNQEDTTGPYIKADA